jgi:hypothetical protein
MARARPLSENEISEAVLVRMIFFTVFACRSSIDHIPKLLCVCCLRRQAFHESIMAAQDVCLNPRCEMHGSADEIVEDETQGVVSCRACGTCLPRKIISSAPEDRPPGDADGPRYY